MVKLSNENGKQAAYLLKQAAAGIRLLTMERDALKKENASLKTAARIEGIERVMDAGGAANPWGGDTDRRAALEKAASAGKLDVIEQAVQLSPNLSQVKVGELVDGPGTSGGSKPSDASKAALDAHVMG